MRNAFTENYSRSKKCKVVLSLLLTSALLSQPVIAAESKNSVKKQSSFNEVFLTSDSDSVKKVTKDFIADIKLLAKDNETLSFISELSEKGYIIKEGDDEEHRPVFVSLQGDIESALAYALKTGKIERLIGVIHTPTPATPLCSKGAITKDLVDSTITDEKRLFTVMKRPAIVREVMNSGGILIAAYPKGGLELRTQEQQEIYLSLKEKYSSNLVDKVLETSSMPWDMVGALYFYKAKEGSWGAFTIMARQANAPVDQQSWGIWFGPVDHPAIKDRVTSVLDYLNEVGHFDMRKYLNE